MSNRGIVFDKIDALAERIRDHAIEPEFSNEVRSRERVPNYALADNDVMWEMVKVIAYSQAVPAERIGAMIDRGVFNDVFGSFDPETIARMNPDGIYKKHWNGKLSPMRFPNKIDTIVECAISLRAIAKQYGSFMKYLKASQFPERVCYDADIDHFWIAFEKACKEAPRYFQKNFTSMCHYSKRFDFRAPNQTVL